MEKLTTSLRSLPFPKHPPPGVGARVSVWRESTWGSAQVCEHRSRQSNAAGIRHEVRVSYDDDGTAAWHDAREIQFCPLVRGDLQPPAAHHPVALPAPRALPGAAAPQVHAAQSGHSAGHLAAQLSMCAQSGGCFVQAAPASSGARNMPGQIATTPSRSPICAPRGRPKETKRFVLVHNRISIEVADRILSGIADRLSKARLLRDSVDKYTFSQLFGWRLWRISAF